MDDNWVEIYSSLDELQIEMIKNTLEANGIGVVVVNKKDRSYLIGHLELFVEREREHEAREFLKDMVG